MEYSLLGLQSCRRGISAAAAEKEISSRAAGGTIKHGVVRPGEGSGVSVIRSVQEEFEETSPGINEQLTLPLGSLPALFAVILHCPKSSITSLTAFRGKYEKYPKIWKYVMTLIKKAQNLSVLTQISKQVEKIEQTGFQELLELLLASSTLALEGLTAVKN